MLFKRRFFFFLSCLLLQISNNAQAQDVAILKYNGGGDWYANPTSVPDLIDFSNTYCQTKISKNPTSVNAGSSDIFNFSMLFMTGHGNVVFNDDEVKNLRNYLISGGFLEISDNYGLDLYIRRELKKIFPELELQEIPKNHPIYQQPFSFPNGLPKIHEHNGKRPQGFGLFYQGRLICFYDYESDLSDGWENPAVHNDSQKIREKALKMGANIIHYAFTN